MNDLYKYLQPLDIHEENRADYKGVALLFLIISLATTATDFLVTWLVITLRISTVSAFISHFLIIAICAYITRFIYKTGSDCRFFFLLTLSLAVIGPLGGAGSLFCFFTMWLYSNYSQDFGDWFATIFPNIKPSIPEEIHEKIITGRDEASREYSVIPFMDIMVSGTEEQKREALSKIGTSFDPRLANVLKRALGDSSNSIRVLAATIIAKIEKMFLERSQQIDWVMEHNPNDPVVKLIAANHYDDYAFTGLLDPVREGENRARAIAAYQDYLRIHPDDEQAKLNLGRIYFRDNRYEEAISFYRKMLTMNQNPSVIGWYLESLFASGWFDELRKSAKEYLPMLEKAAQNIEVIELAKAWAIPPKGAA